MTSNVSTMGIGGRLGVLEEERGVGGMKGLTSEGFAAVRMVMEMVEGAPSFGGALGRRTDYFLTAVLLVISHAQGRSVVVKQAAGLTGRAAGTARALLQGLEKRGLAENHQRVGRSELYRPTAALYEEINRWAGGAMKAWWSALGEVGDREC